MNLIKEGDTLVWNISNGDSFILLVVKAPSVINEAYDGVYRMIALYVPPRFLDSHKTGCEIMETSKFLHENLSYHPNVIYTWYIIN